MIMSEQILEKKALTKTNNKISFEDLWNMDIDNLFNQYDLNSDTEENNDLITDEDWLIF
jgi:hypothetical protein